MQTAISNQNPGLRLASVLKFKISNPAVSTKTVNPVYYVEDCQLSGDSINVNYLLNDNWFNTVISMAVLRHFVLTSGLNEYCYDYNQNGHVQVSGSFDLDTFMDENLNNAVMAYLRSKKVGQNVN